MSGVEVGWKEARDGKTKTLHQPTKLLIVGLSPVTRFRLRGWDSHDVNQWLRTPINVS